MVRQIAVIACAVACCGIAVKLLLTSTSAKLLRILGANYTVLDEAEREMARRLLLSGQHCILQGWPRPGVRDAEKRRLVRRAAQHLDNIASKVTQERVETLQAPACLQKPHNVVAEHGTRTDMFYWLRDDDRKDADMLAHLAAENEYCARVLADTETLQQQLYLEMRGRIQEADRSVPLRRGSYYYYSDTLEGKQYRVHKRRAVPPGAGPVTEATVMDLSTPEEVLLDENVEAAKHKFYSVGSFAVSDDHKTVAYAEDTNGSEQYTIRVKDLASGRQVLTKAITRTSGNVVWAADNKTLFYVLEDAMHRPYQVWRHVLGSDPKDDVKVFEEEDEAFYVHVGRSRDKQLLYISCGSSVTNETRYVPALDPTVEFKVILPREQDCEYEVSHWYGTLIMVKRTKDKFNSEVVVAPLSNPARQRTVLKHNANFKIEDIAVSARYLAVFGRTGGLQEATVYTLPTDKKGDSIKLAQGRKLEFKEPAFDMGMAAQGEFDWDVLAISYTSLTTPPTVYWHNMATGTQVVKKVHPVLGGFKQENYVTERIWAAADDGVKVPISLVYNKQLVKPGSGPHALHLDVYGAYEACNDAAFSSNRLSLLDRGIVYAIAHVRGGGEMGRQWYEDGKFLKKKNTFTDTIACALHLIAEGWTDPRCLTLEGRSAGGMTVGAVTNMRPDLFNGVVMGVPFVDCLTTMLDPTIPLTTIEYEEWGNPEEKEYYDYMKSYSPIDNIQAQNYPNILVTAGLNDPRVAYWEPAKFVAKLRRIKTDNHILAFKCNLSAGHFSQSGRFDRLKELALDYAFIIKCAGKIEIEPFCM